MGRQVPFPNVMFGGKSLFSRKQAALTQLWAATPREWWRAPRSLINTARA
jgi:hypothetical protein